MAITYTYNKDRLKYVQTLHIFINLYCTCNQICSNQGICALIEYWLKANQQRFFSQKFKKYMCITRD